MVVVHNPIIKWQAISDQVATNQPTSPEIIFESQLLLLQSISGNDLHIVRQTGRK
jgi:hypothetical protein